MVVKLYGDPISTCTTRVMVCLHEKAVDFELLPVNLFANEQKLTSFLAKNPFGQIPVLEDEDLIVFESRAITTYISEKHKETEPQTEDLTRHKDLKEATLVKIWSEVESHQFNPPISAIVHQFFVSPLQGKSPDKKIIDENKEKLEKVLDVYEEKLGGTKYLAGDFYSLADLHHLPYTYYFMKTPLASLVNDRPRVKAWWDEISSRPAFLKVAVGMNFDDKIIESE